MKCNEIKDCDGNIISYGSLLIDINCPYLTYQVRIKDNVLVLHTGGCYSLLTPSRVKNLKILKSTNINLLGCGNNLFNF